MNEQKQILVNDDVTNNDNESKVDNNNSNNSKEWTRGQVLEAVLNIQMDFDVSKANWDKTKEDLLKKIGSGEAGNNDVNSEAELAQIKEEKQYKELLLHWRGLQEDFKDLDHGFELVEDTLKQGKLYYESTTLLYLFFRRRLLRSHLVVTTFMFVRARAQ